MAKIVVTGATGFIGKRLVAALESLGHQIYVRYYYTPMDCDIIYHLACPSDNDSIHNRTQDMMDTILDITRKAVQICPTALFVNASSMGAGIVDVDTGPQNAYNVAKRCMEVYLEHSHPNHINYRLPAVYGEGMHDDQFIKRCVDGTATRPTNPNRLHPIAHIDDVVESLVNLTPLHFEELRLEYIYEQFTTGRRGLHRPTSST